MAGSHTRDANSSSLKIRLAVVTVGKLKVMSSHDRDSQEERPNTADP